MQFASFLVSTILHLVLIIFSVNYSGISKIKPVDLNREVHMVELVYMEEQQPAPPQVPEPAQPDPPRHDPVPEPAEPEIQIPKPKPAPKPEPDPKPKPEPESQPKPEPEPEPEPKPKPEPSPAPPEKKEPTAQERLANELAALRSDVERETSNQAPIEQTGLQEIYAARAERLIKGNWRYPRIGGTKNLVVRVEVEIDQTGRVVRSRVVRSSGREDFDHSALRAIEDTRQLPEPPTVRIRTLIIDFNLQDLV
ncbi:MAG: TonB family protein [Desulfonatronovibrio sp.]